MVTPFATVIESLVDLGIPGILGGLLGVLLGWRLTEQSASKAREAEWERAERATVAQKEQGVAVELDDVLASFDFEIHRTGSGFQPVSPSDLLAAKESWDPVWARHKYRILDLELYERLEAIGRYLDLAQRQSQVDDAPTYDITLQRELAVIMGRWALARMIFGKGQIHPPFLPTAAEWHWVWDHGPSEDPWTCFAAWIELHKHDDSVLFFAAGVRDGLASQQQVPDFGPDWRWEGRWALPDPSAWRYPPRRDPSAS